MSNPQESKSTKRSVTLGGKQSFSTGSVRMMDTVSPTTTQTTSVTSTAVKSLEVVLGGKNVPQIPASQANMMDDDEVFIMDARRTPPATVRPVVPVPTSPVIQTPVVVPSSLPSQPQPQHTVCVKEAGSTQYGLPPKPMVHVTTIPTSVTDGAGSTHYAKPSPVSTTEHKEVHQSVSPSSPAPSTSAPASPRITVEVSTEKEKGRCKDKGTDHHRHRHGKGHHRHRTPTVTIRIEGATTDDAKTKIRSVYVYGRDKKVTIQEPPPGTPVLFPVGFFAFMFVKILDTMP